MTFLDTPLRQTEASFQKQVVEVAEMLGWRVRHDRATNAPRRCATCGAERRLPRNDAGYPDLLLIRRPRILWLELKSDRGTVTQAQRAMLEDLRACGQEAYVIRPRQWESLVKLLR